jgi:hypothetical protein
MLFIDRGSMALLVKLPVVKEALADARGRLAPISLTRDGRALCERIGDLEGRLRSWDTVNPDRRLELVGEAMGLVRECAFACEIGLFELAAEGVTAGPRA